LHLFEMVYQKVVKSR